MTDIHSQRLTLSLLFFAHISCGYRLTRALTRIIIMIMEKGEKIMKMMKKQKNNSRLNCKLARLNLYYFLRSCNPLSMKWCQSMTSSMWYLLCCVYEKIILGKGSIEKKTFSFGHCPNKGGGVYPCPIFLALFLEVHFWSIKRVYFFKNANVLNF